jgi:hypothetical protein
MQRNPFRGTALSNQFFCHFNAENRNFPLAGNPTPDYKGATAANAARHAPFVYRLGRQIFILERGVRLP